MEREHSKVTDEHTGEHMLVSSSGLAGSLAGGGGEGGEGGIEERAYVCVRGDRHVSLMQGFSTFEVSQRWSRMNP